MEKCEFCGIECEYKTRAMAHDAVLAEVRALQCCGNCYYMDIIVDKGGVCTFNNEEISCDRNGYCDDWKLNPKD